MIRVKVAVLTLLAGISLTTTALESQINLNQSIVLDISPFSLKIGDEIDISIDSTFDHFRNLVFGSRHRFSLKIFQSLFMIHRL